MTERAKSYIGVSGVADSDQQLELQRAFEAADLNSSRVLALGVKATHKTQYLDMENKYGKEWYPVGEQLSRALDANNDELRIAQIFIDNQFAQDALYRSEYLARIRRRGKMWLNALQFDMLPWHRESWVPGFLDELKRQTNLPIVLQAHKDTIKDTDPRQFIARLEPFTDLLDYVLVDSSHGRGVRINAGNLRPYLDELYASDKLSRIGISIAGGLNAQVVYEEIPDLLKYYPDLSWDAEGQLHSIGMQDSRPLDMSIVSEYFVASSDVIKGV